MNNEAQERKDDIQIIEAWIETHHEKFSIMGLSKRLRVSEKTCAKVAKSHPLVTIPDDELNEKPGPQKRFFANGSEPEPTIEGVMQDVELREEYLDELGRQARAEFQLTVKQRRANAKKRSIVVKKI